MKLYLILSSCCFIFSFATCAPIPIQYSIINKPFKNNSDTVAIHKGEQQLFVQFYQHHYPGNSVTSTINISLKNLSDDTLFLHNALPLFSINSKVNAVDSSQLNKQLMQQNISYVLPRSSVTIEGSYAQQNKKIREFFSLLKGEELKIKIGFNVSNRYYFQDSISLKPSSERL